MNLRTELANEVAGHMPVSLYDRDRSTEWLVRGAARWGFDHVIEPLLDDICQVPGIRECIGEELYERLRQPWMADPGTEEPRED